MPIIEVKISEKNITSTISREIYRPARCFDEYFKITLKIFGQKKPNR